ncbi:MAG TPA: DUF6448 family protein [Terriglobales bacterium]|jgi:hypothetical protein|nr:DUF6448 family protein [Terriglobales bacterium]
MSLFFKRAVPALLWTALLMVPVQAAAHCDTLGGPVVSDARAALASADVTPALKWVKPEQEAEVRAAFARTLKVRSQGADARELADTYFFETLVRLHRQSEGAAYTGLKPADAVEPAIAATDQAIETGDSERLVAALQREVAEAVRARVARVLEAKKHAGQSVAAGRAYVAAYVELLHYVEALHGGAEETTEAAVH